MTSEEKKSLDLTSILSGCLWKIFEISLHCHFEFYLAVTASEIIANGPVQLIFWPDWHLTSIGLGDIDPTS